MEININDVNEFAKLKGDVICTEIEKKVKDLLGKDYVLYFDQGVGSIDYSKGIATACVSVIIEKPFCISAEEIVKAKI